jgi:hypothetical protein
MQGAYFFRKIRLFNRLLLLLPLSLFRYPMIILLIPVRINIHPTKCLPHLSASDTHFVIVSHQVAYFLSSIATTSLETDLHTFPITTARTTAVLFLCITIAFLQPA